MINVIRKYSLLDRGGILLVAGIYAGLYVLNLIVPLDRSLIFHYNNYVTRIWSWSEFALAGAALVVLLQQRRLSITSVLLGFGLSLLSSLSIYARTHDPIDAAQEGVIVLLTFLAATTLYEVNKKITIPAFQGGIRKIFRSLLFGLLAALPLAVLNNLFFYFSEGWSSFRDVILSALLALSPGIAEEIIFRYLVMALCAQWIPDGVRPSWEYYTMIALAVVPHSLNHLPDLFPINPAMGVFMLVSTSLLFGLPMALLQIKKNLETAIAFHWSIDFIRFLFGY